MCFNAQPVPNSRLACTFAHGLRTARVWPAQTIPGDGLFCRAVAGDRQRESAVNWTREAAANRLTFGLFFTYQ